MSSLMVDLQEAITAFLLTKCPRVFFKEADKKAAFRYVVFDLPNAINTGEPPEVWVLDVDGWDDESDTSGLDNLMASIDGDGDEMDPTGLHRRTFHLAGGKAQVYRETRLAPPVEGERKLKRRRYTYQVRVF